MDRIPSRMAVAVVAAAALVAACGGNGGGNDGGGRDVDVVVPPDPLAGPTPEARLDGRRFVAYMMALVARPDETREPASLDGFAAPADDAAEPEPAS